MEEPGAARWHKTSGGGIVFAMTAFVYVWFADVLVTGMVGLAVCFILFLLSLVFRERRKQRRLLEQRGRQRRGHWGYE